MCPTLAVIMSILSTTCVQHNIPCNLFKAMAYVESRYNPEAVSRTHDKGLFQISPVAARHYGLKDPFDPKQNAEVAAKHLSYLKRRFKTWDAAIAAYNWGSNKVEQLETLAGLHPIVKLYVRKVRKQERSLNKKFVKI